MPKALRGIACSDTHCGHVAGLTPPGWAGGDKAFPGRAEARDAAWRKWTEILRAYGPFDFGLFVGDGIDGRAEKDGGADIIVADQAKQADCLAECLDAVPFRGKRPTWAAVYGTPYHVGKCEVFERLAYSKLGIPAELQGDQVTVEVGGALIDIRHDIGSGDLALRKEAQTDRLWRLEHGGRPASIYLRGHVHTYARVDGGAAWTCASLPSLQLSTRFGARRVHGRVIHWGVLILSIEGGVTSWHPVCVPLGQFNPHAAPRLA
jgi:hypothetical protein